MLDLLPGKLLIADPFLRDPNFKRSVVFMCEHKDEGSFGFILNRLHGQALHELINGMASPDFSVHYGGPVQPDSVHFLHQCPALIPGGAEVTDGIYWGGDFEVVTSLLNTKRLTRRDIRFFIGYSGWAQGQLVEEMKQHSWITGEASAKLVFSANTDTTWKDALRQLGGEYVQMANYPIDPLLN